MVINLHLRSKLIIAFTAIIMASFLAIGGGLSWLFIHSNRDMLLDAAVKNNQQITKNIDTALQPLLSLSMYPVLDPQIYQIMEKDYSGLAYPLYERQNDFDIVNSKIRNNFFLYSTLIDSVLIYQSKNHMVVGRSNLEYMNHSYFENNFSNETYIKEILQKNGLYVAVGIHPDRLFSPKSDPVVSIGRAIINPYSKEQLGLILMNIDVNQLKELWSDIQFTENTKFYLVDDQKKIIYSQKYEELGKNAESVIGKDFTYITGQKKETKENQESYLISASSKISNWQAVTIIPKHELFQNLSFVIKIIIIMMLAFLLLSIFLSYYIATTITKPLSILEEKMKQVSQGNLDVTIGIHEGEIGKIGKTIDRMLTELRELIQRIYKEEEEKRKLEILALQSQIRPHFMYNTINVIKWMAKIQGASGIEEALSAFSAVIRFTAKTENELVTINEEVEFTMNYTKILDFRYFNKFEVSFEVDPQVREYKTLKFLLQPLVENSIFHAFDNIEHKGKVLIRIYEESDHLVMLVSDNGRGISETEKEKAEGVDKLNSIGIKNIRKRIQLHFGERYGLSITAQESSGTIAKIEVPIIK
ncbi:sensor histidine kinase [Neobacillus cucumis]|nr:sensor histidine kinase [Neobacillus cucumis]